MDTPMSAAQPRNNKMKLLIPVLIVVLVILLLILDARRRSAEAQLKQLSLRLEQLQGNPEQNAERARQVVTSVRKHMQLDTTVEPTVATIVDVEKLRQNNPFYNSAENGDFLVVTPTRAILYDADADVILDVVPVQIEQQPAAQNNASAAASR
jgi:cytochrome c biogenesis factor